MLKKEEIISYLKTQKEDFFTNYKLVKLGLFGSFAKGEAKENSDIDLIIEFQINTPNLSEKKAALKATVKAKFNRDVDLCREKYIKPYFKTQVLQSAIYV